MSDDSPHHPHLEKSSSKSLKLNTQVNESIMDDDDVFEEFQSVDGIRTISHSNHLMIPSELKSPTVLQFAPGPSKKVHVHPCLNIDKEYF